MIRLLFASVSVMAIATTAMAQDAPSKPASNHGAAAEAGASIAEVIVTASRREENLQHTALSIQALSADALVRANVTSPEGLANIAPGVQIAAAGPFAQTYIRGVGNFATNAFAEGAVAYHLDGVYISRSWATRGMFYDLERVEVLKGPQGTLYGRNASGGAINVITAKPKLGQYGGFAEGEVGNYNLVQGTAAVNLPLGDTVAVRATGQVTSRDAYLSDGYDDDKTQAGRLQVLWEPDANISLLLSGNYQHTGGQGPGTALMPQLPGDAFRGGSDPAVTAIIKAQPGLGPLLVYPKNDGFLDDTVYSVSGELNWNLGFGTLTLLPAYRDAKLEDLNYVPGFLIRANEHNKQTSVELRLGNSGEKLKWVVGGYYFHEQSTNESGKSILFVQQGVNTQDTPDHDYRTTSYAAFGQATYSLTDRFRLTGGLRYTYERKINDQLLVNYSLPNRSPPPLCITGTFDPTSPYPPQFCHLSVPISEKATFNNVSWKVGAEYDLAERSMAYANVSTGFKSGGFYSAPPPNSFRPEKMTAFEAGVKNRFLDNRLQVNVEAFYWRYRDHQESFVGPTTVPGLFTFVTVNAGRATSYGADVDVLFHPTASDELSLKVQYNKTKYNSFEFSYLSSVFGPPVTGCAVGAPSGGFQNVNCAGQPLVRAPLWTGTAGYSHRFDLGDNGDLSAGFNTQFSSGQYLSTDFLGAGHQGAFVVGDFDLTYTPLKARWSVTAFVHNIWDTAIYTQAFRYPFVSPSNPLANPDGVLFGTLRPPRTFGGRVRLTF